MTGDARSKKVLMVAYHFPPIRISSGIQRSLSLARYLRESGWHPTVLSISPKAYPVVDTRQVKDIPPDVEVIRAFGRDASKTMSVRGRYPSVLALPDRWISWLPAALWAGWKAIRRERPDLIWSTYPIATAHLIGGYLSRISKTPWIADFRDQMTEPGYPDNQWQWAAYRWIERMAAAHARKLVFTTPGARRMYCERYGDRESADFEVVPNGFDEEIFRSAEQRLGRVQSRQEGPLRLLHSGVLYPWGRDPTSLFDALAELKSAGKIHRDSINVILRAPGHEELYRSMLAERDINDVVLMEAGVGYEEALGEMMSVDGLLVVQDSSCNFQIPAKIYEYFRAGKPIVALADPSGDTAQAIRDVGVRSIFRVDDKDHIKSGILRFLDDLSFRDACCVAPDQAARYSRRTLVEVYASILNSVSS